MSKAKNRSPKQLVFQLAAMILVVLLLAGCARNTPSGKDKPDDEGKPRVTEQQDEEQDEDQKEQPDEQQDEDKDQQPDEKQDANPEQQQDAGSNIPGPPATAAESFGAYSQAKGELVAKITDALSNNPGTEMDSLNLLALAMADMALLPASSFGLGQEAAEMALGFFEAEDIVYSENGNQYSVKYRGADGENNELQGVYDKAADSLRCTALSDGKEGLISEYRKTSFGYVGQLYVINEDGSTYLYQVAVSGKNGAVGMSEASAAPSALTGNEAIDFPKQCPVWYAFDGDAFTGVASDGSELSFVYTPSED